MHQNKNAIIKCISFFSVVLIILMFFSGCNYKAKEVRTNYKSATQLMREEKWEDAAVKFNTAEIWMEDVGGLDKYKDAGVLKEKCLGQYVISSINKELEDNGFPVLTDLKVEKYLNDVHYSHYNRLVKIDKIDLYSEKFEELSNEAKLFVLIDVLCNLEAPYSGICLEHSTIRTENGVYFAYDDSRGLFLKYCLAKLTEPNPDTANPDRYEPHEVVYAWEYDPYVEATGASEGSDNSNYNSKTTCTNCNGTGYVKYYYGDSDLEAVLSGHDPYSTGPCPLCNGKGYY